MTVVVANMLFFAEIPGEMIQFDEHMFETGWFNHQLIYVYISIYTQYRFHVFLPYETGANFC